MPEAATVFIDKLEGNLPKRESVTRRTTEANPKVFGESATYRDATLQELSKEYTFFCHSALFVYGNWTKDPIADYVTMEDPNCNPFWITFDRPIFSGLFFRRPTDKRTEREWNYRLMGCANDDWPGLLAFIQSLSGVHYEEQRFHSTIVQKLPLLDYLAIAKHPSLPNPLPMVEVYMVGLTGNDRNVYFEPANNPPLDKIKARIGPPFPQTVAQAERVFSGQLKTLNDPIMIPLEYE